MPRIRKCFIHNTLVSVTFRAEEGLPVVATPYMKVTLESIIARSYSKYPVTICHFIWMNNHFHGLFVVNNPEDVKDFICYLKRELAHAINRLLGRKKRTVWCNGYDSPVILDAEKAIEQIVYLYTNPQRANLVETIDEYPNLSTWGYFGQGGGRIKAGHIGRSDIPEIPQSQLNNAEQESLADSLLSVARGEFVADIDPNGWIRCFPELDESDIERVNSEILTRVRHEEERLSSERASKVLGKEQLRRQDIRAEYVPQKRGKRMICLSSLREMRVNFIEWFREQEQAACQALRDWSPGNVVSGLSPGFFIPGGYIIANLNPLFAPL